MDIKEPKLTENSYKVLMNRCSIQDEEGHPVESPGEIFYRVASFIAKAEINWGDGDDVNFFRDKFFESLVSNRLACTTSALFEAGHPEASNQLSPCFVLPIEDSISSIFDTLGKSAVIQKNAGGTGYNFSNIRMSGDTVQGVPKMASGPVDFLQAYNAALAKVLQGRKKHGGKMGILNADHPDIFDFIKVKDEDESIKGFNISVGVEDRFMKAVIKDSPWKLINPRNKKVVRTVSAKDLFRDICEHAWLTGDPGMLFLDRMEKDNFTPSLGVLWATNPCGEQPLLPYESCNLSSIVLPTHLKKCGDTLKIDWKLLADTVASGVRFLDDMIEVNNYILPETEDIVKNGNRKIGLGVIGFGHLLFRLGIPYNSDRALEVAEKLAGFIKDEAIKASRELAKVRGPFPNYEISLFAGDPDKFLRNQTMLTIAPTGAVSIIANTTSGIEPAYSLVFTRRTFYHGDDKNRPTENLRYVDPVFKEVLESRGLYSNDLMKRIDTAGGSIQEIYELPSEIRDVFVVTSDISWEWHVKVQSAWQKYIDNAVSKTINFPNNADVEDVVEAYMMAWKTGCKGITIYRDGSRRYQVLTTKKTKERAAKS